MQHTVIGQFRIGEDINIALDVVEGDPVLVDQVTAAIRHYPHGQVSHPMTIAARAASGDIPAGWNLSLAASASSGLRPGEYIVDAKFVTNAGEVDITDQSAFIEISEAAIR